MIGWIKLHRSICKNWTWEDKPFSKGQAWIDLLLLANSQDIKKPCGADIVTYEKGTVNRSIMSLSERWGWSRKKTTTFLQQLEKDNMICLKRNTHGTVIFILKYSTFQKSEKLERTTKEQPKNSRGATKEQQRNNQRTTKEQQRNNKGTTEEQQRNTNKNNKNNKELKEVAEVVCGNSDSDNYLDDFENIGNDDKLQVFKDRVFLTNNQVGELLEVMGLEVFDEYLDKLNEYILKTDAKIKNHYETMLKWYREDCQVKKGEKA